MAADGSASSSGAAPSLTWRLAGRLSRHSAAYLTVAGVNLALGLISVVVFTRLLSPHEYGELAVLLFFQAWVTVVLNLGSLQGTLSWAVGASVDDDGDQLGDSEQPAATDRRRGLTTGVLMTATAGAFGAIAIAAVAPWAAGILLHDRGQGRLVVWAGVGAGLVAVWRLAANLLRYERRPIAYLVAVIAQGGGSLLAAALLAEGGGLEGVIAGLALGSLVAVTITLALIAPNLAWRVSWADAKGIMQRGRTLAPVVLSLTTIQLADVFLVSRSVPASGVGAYRVATRIGALATYWSSAFNMAWGPMRRGDPLHVAADRKLGRAAVSSTVATYYLILTFGVVLSLALLADAFVRIAPSSYQDAAPLIPLTALAASGHGAYVLMYRTSEHPARRKLFVRLSMLMVVVFVGVALVLVPAIGAAGAPCAALAGWLTGIAGFAVAASRGAHKVHYDLPRIGGALAAALACFGLAQLLDPAVPVLVRALLCESLYVVALLTLGIFPARAVRAFFRQLRHRARGEQERSSRRAGELRRRARALDPVDRTVLQLLARKDGEAEDVARRTGLQVDEVHERLVGALRTIGGAGGDADPSRDAEIGAALLTRGAIGDREAAVRNLWESGVDPVDIDALARCLATVRRNRRKILQPDPGQPTTTKA
jgi:O-antigen/teichoic acid export membrane protein